MANHSLLTGRQRHSTSRHDSRVGHEPSNMASRLLTKRPAGRVSLPKQQCTSAQPAHHSRPKTSLWALSEDVGEGSSAAPAVQSAAGAEGVEYLSSVDSHTDHQAASVYQPASISRVFIGVQPGRGLAKQITKVGKPSGPMSLMLLLFTLVGTVSAAVRQRFEAAARECTTCRGFGINRCTLCNGSGAVGWEGKWDHREPCPMCLGKRFIDCPECGGHFHRRIFSHHHHTGLTVTELVEAEQTPVSKLGD